MDKPPLFFIHGMWSRPRQWDALRAHFEARGYATHAPALPWHDVEPSAPPAPELATIDVRDYVRFLVAEVEKIGRPPVLIGHSMGGMLAQLVAERLQPAGLVLLSPGPTATTAAFGIAPLRTLFGIATTSGWWRQPTLIDPARARWGIFNETPVDVASQEIGALVWDSGRALFQMALPWFDGTRATKVDYARLISPALVIVGDQDRITPPTIARATARQLLGRVDYRELPGVGHWLFHDPVRETVATTIDDFLARLS